MGSALLFVLALTVLLIQTAEGGYSDYTSAEEQALLDQHNLYRTGVSPEAANMAEMSWDDYLTYKAQTWSDECVFEHPDENVHTEYKGIGQNLWIQHWNIPNPPPPVVTEPVESWYNETYDYNYDGNKCQDGEVCGHYTQIIWADTTKVGCGIKHCPVATGFGGPYTNAWLITCNYSPHGNNPDVPPYEEGNYCSECGEGIYCKNKLCSACNPDESGCECRIECQCGGTKSANTCACACLAGYFGSNCQNYCEDTHEYCGANPGWPTDWCGLGYWFVDLYCPKMCGTCTPGPKHPTC